MAYDDGSQKRPYYSRSTSENNALDEAVWMQQRITGFSYCASGLLRGKRPRLENRKHKNVVFKRQFLNFYPCVGLKVVFPKRRQHDL
jgi:hypothetical protein